VYKGSFDVINVCVNRVSTILNLTHSAINGPDCPILPKRKYRSAILRKKQMTRSLPHAKNVRQRSFNNFWDCALKCPVGWVLTVHHKQIIGRLSIEQWWWQHFYNVLKMSVNRASTIFGLASWKLHGLCGEVTP
jgi:hypothetical protein